MFIAASLDIRNAIYECNPNSMFFWNNSYQSPSHKLGRTSSMSAPSTKRETWRRIKGIGCNRGSTERRISLRSSVSEKQKKGDLEARFLSFKDEEWMILSSFWEFITNLVIYLQEGNSMCDILGSILSISEEEERKQLFTKIKYFNALNFDLCVFL